MSKGRLALAAAGKRRISPLHEPAPQRQAVTKLNGVRPRWNKQGNSRGAAILVSPAREPWEDYGETGAGGAYGHGTVFKLTP